jgi:hypothetical protein
MCRADEEVGSGVARQEGESSVVARVHGGCG